MSAAPVATATTATTAAAPAPDLKTEKEIVDAFNLKRQQQSQIMARIAEFESEIHENTLVIDALKPLEDTRRAHRLVGGALIEKTVGEVRPEVQQYLDNCGMAIKQLQEQLIAKEKDIEEFMTKYKITRKGAGGDQAAAGAGGQAAAAAAGGSKQQQQGGGAGVLA